MKNAKSNKQKQQNRDTTSLWILAFMVCCLLAYMTFHTLTSIAKFQNSWESLQGKSNGHFIMVTTYRDCRNAFFGKTTANCQLEALAYGREMGVEDRKAILADIVTLSNNITQRP